MKIISWNVNGIRANFKKGAFAEIFKLSPDILCVQETKAEPLFEPVRIVLESLKTGRTFYEVKE
jgi:exodeoxyribonuclease-3